MAFFNNRKSKTVAAKAESVVITEPKTVEPETTPQNRSAQANTIMKQVQEISLKQIVPNQHQPRRRFTNESIAELAETIAAHGLLQPIILREYQANHYEIIAGERRFRAVKALAWLKIPAIVETMDAQESAEMAVIENLQREDLNPIDEAYAYANLLEINRLTQAQLAERLGKSQSYIANKLRLLKLPEEAQQAVSSGEITARHGRALLQLTGTEQAIVLKRILADKLTVTQTDDLIKQLETGQPASVPTVATPTQSTKSKSKRRQHIGQQDLRVVANTVKQSLHLIKSSGVKIDYEENFADNQYTITIHASTSGTKVTPATTVTDHKEEN